MPKTSLLEGPHAPLENFENLGLLECISCILGMNKAIQTEQNSFNSTVHKNCKINTFFFLPIVINLLLFEYRF